MTDYLRDYINENVGPECGGDEVTGIVNPNTIQKQLNELKSRVDKLEAGIGFTLSFSKELVMPLAIYGNNLFANVPQAGTISSFNYVSSGSGTGEGIVGINIRRYSSDGTEVYQQYVDVDNTERSVVVPLDIAISVADIVVFTYDTISASGTQHTIPYAVFTITLPEETYNLKSA